MADDENLKRDTLITTMDASDTATATNTAGVDDDMKAAEESTTSKIKAAAAKEGEEEQTDEDQQHQLSDAIIDPVVLKIVQDRFATNQDHYHHRDHLTGEKTKVAKKQGATTRLSSSLSSSGVSVATATTTASTSTTNTSTNSEVLCPPPPLARGVLTRQVSVPGAFSVEPTRKSSAVPCSGVEEDSLLSSSWVFNQDCSISSIGTYTTTTTSAIGDSSSSNIRNVGGDSRSGGHSRQQQSSTTNADTTSSSEFLSSLPIAAEVVEECPYADLEAEIKRRVEEEIGKRSSPSCDNTGMMMTTNQSSTTHTPRNNSTENRHDHHKHNDMDDTSELQSMFGTSATWRSRCRRDDVTDPFGSTGSEDIRRLTRVLKRANGVTRGSVKGEDLEKLAKKLREAMKRRDSFVSNMGDDDKNDESNTKLASSSSGKAKKWKLLFCMFASSSKKRRQRQQQQEEKELEEFQFP